MSTTASRPYRVTLVLPGPAGDAALVPPDAQVLAEAAAAAVAAEDLLTAWTSARALLSVVIGSASRADALSAGWAIARALGGAPGTSVEAEPYPARHLTWMPL